MWGELRLWLGAVSMCAVCVAVGWVAGIDWHYVALVPFVLALVVFVVWPRLRGRSLR